MMLAKITLKPNKERPLLRRHPWVYATAVDRVDGKVYPGCTISIFSSEGQFIAKGSYSPRSQIRARALSWDESEVIDHAFFKRKIAKALALRQQWVNDTNAVRLIFGESDGLPGLIVDQYDQTLVCQFLFAGMEYWKDAIVAALKQLVPCVRIVERSDAAVRVREGLEPQVGCLEGDMPAEPVQVIECGVKYTVDVLEGHKTGFYIDQRDNRHLLASLAQGKTVLNMFCYTGGFSLAALRGGASHVTSVDSSGDALAMAKKQMDLNGFEPSRAEWIDEDAFAVLTRFRKEGRKFDVVVLDPPKFAPSASHLDKAVRAYKEINRAGMQLLNPNGLLLTFSCSGAMDAALFEKVIANAATEAMTHSGDKTLDFRLVKRLSSGFDHPLLVSFPEGDYLKGIMLQRI
jgi:23S rRNA (cytosine1962-C5)-methyltransferase